MTDAPAPGQSPPQDWMRPRHTVWDRFIQVLTILASVTAIAGVWVWVDEKNDREDERRARQEERATRSADSEVRRMALIAQAQEIISSAGSRGNMNSYVGNLQWSIDLLTRENQPISVATPKTLTIFGLDFTCAKVFIQAKSTSIFQSTFRNSSISVSGRVTFFRTGVSGSDFDISYDGGDNPLNQEPLEMVQSVVSDTRISTQNTAPYVVSDSAPVRLESTAMNIENSRIRQLVFTVQDKDAKLVALGPSRQLRIPNPDCALNAQGVYGCQNMGDSGAGDDPRTDDGGVVKIDLAKPDCQRPSLRARTFAVYPKK